MGDDGVGLRGLARNPARRGENGPTLDNVYLGPAFTPEQVEKAITKSGCAYRRIDNIEEEVAELLARGFIVARFSGPMEFGPRALGNRTILANASDRTTNDRLNRAL